jgi:pimeloyl-ACP methyl ester carboxylesterase
MNKILVLVIILIPTISFCQDKGLIKGIDARHFQLKTVQDTIDFILVNGKTDTVKPVLIFCQGSSPVPLVTIDTKGNKFFTLLTNFDYKKVVKEYHLVVISVPNTPLEVPEKKLNKRYFYVTDTSNQDSYSSIYLAKNYAENYVRRTKDVIDFLYTQKWVNAKNIILFGHSQGSGVAVGASLNNDKVSKLGYASGNPTGRIDQLIREQRQLAKEGKITREKSQKRIAGIYDMWQLINKNPNAMSSEFGDPNRTWTSFSKPVLNDLLKLIQPLYVVYGTEDIASVFCDLLPIYFTREQKTNLTFVPYLGLEHNFFEVGLDGNPNYTKGHWQQVMDEFIKWAK